MTVLSRKILKSFFSKGRRPSEEHFRSLIDSFVHKQEDELPGDGQTKAQRGFVAVMPSKDDVNTSVAQRSAPAEEATGQGSGLQWHSFTVKAADFKDNSPEKSIPVGDLPAKTLIMVSIIKHSESFGGKGISGLTLSVGTKGSKALYGKAYDVYQKPGGTRMGRYELMRMTNWDRKTKFYVTATAEGANLDKLSEGRAEILFLTSSPA